MQLAWLRRGSEKISGEELKRFLTTHSHLPELICQRTNTTSWLLPIPRLGLLAVSSCVDVFSLLRLLSIIRRSLAWCVLSLLRLELLFRSQSWSEELAAWSGLLL